MLENSLRVLTLTHGSYVNTSNAAISSYCQFLFVTYPGISILYSSDLELERK